MGDVVKLVADRERDGSPIRQLNQDITDAINRAEAASVSPGFIIAQLHIHLHEYTRQYLDAP